MGARLSYPETDQSGKVAVVTGGNTGIGYETAKGLALLGAHVIIACRSEEKARGAIERMRGEVSQEQPDKTINVEFMSLDLSSLQSVKKFIEDYNQKGLLLHLLINNAGLGLIGQTDIQRTVDGNEWSFQVNHLGPFYLTLELLPVILSSAPGARIVFVSSVMHKYANAFNPNNLQGEQGYSGTNQYSNTKLFNIMTAYALQRKLGSGKGVTVSALHPGFVRTEFGRNATTVSSAFIALGNALGISRTPKEGAATTLYAAVHPGLNKEEFVYYSDCKAASSNPPSRNVTHQDQLWDISCNLLKDHLSPDIWREYGPSQPMTSGEGGEEQPSLEQMEEHPSEQVEERPSEQVEEQPPSEQVEERPSEQVEERPSEQVEERPSEQMEESPSEQVEESPSEQVEEQPSEQVEEHPSEQVEEQPSEQVEEHPSEQVEEHPSEQVEEQP